MDSVHSSLVVSPKCPLIQWGLEERLHRIGACVKTQVPQVETEVGAVGVVAVSSKKRILWDLSAM